MPSLKYHFAAGYIPNPFAVMYGATKAFVSQFAASLAIEVSNRYQHLLYFIQVTFPIFFVCAGPQ